MRKIYAESWALFRQGVLAFLAMAVFVEALVFFLPSSTGASIGTSLAAIILAFFAHRHFLKGEDHFSLSAMFKKSKYDQRGIGRFIWFSFLLLILTGILALAFVFTLFDLDGDQETLSALSVLAGSIASWIVLSLFGAILPAAANNDARFHIGFGIAKFPTMMVRLLLGPGLASVALVVTIFALVAILSVMGIEFSFWIERFVGVFGYFLTFFTVILTAATLCSVYRTILPAPELSEV